VVGYELSFCPETAQQLSGGNSESATSTTIDALNVMGLGVLCDGRLAFINCGRHMLLQDYFSLLPPSDVVVEIQDTVSAEEPVITACEGLKKFGYRIALDNFVPSDRRQALVPYADFIKIDIRKVAPKQSASLAELNASQHCRMLALQVDTREQFVTASKSGFTRFQGYFFRQPESLQARQIPANQATYVRLLKAVSKPQVDFVEIEALAVFSAVALPKFSASRAVLAGPLGSPRLEPDRRTGSSPLDTDGDHSGHGTGKVFRPRAVCAGAGSLLRIGGTQGRAWQFRSVSDGHVFAYGSDPVRAHRHRDRRFVPRS
jgi:hypothetical protein